MKKNFYLILFLFFLIALSIGTSQNIFAQQFFWERAENIETGNAKFLKTVNSQNKQGKIISVIVWQEIEEIKKEKNIYLSSKVYIDDKCTTNLRFAGPFKVEGDTIPEIFSVAINKKGKILVAAFSLSSAITIFTSTDYGSSFSEKKLSEDSLSYVGPRIFTTANDGFILFATQNLTLETEANYRIMYSKSDDGEKWADFLPFAATEDAASPTISTLFTDGYTTTAIFQAYQVFHNQTNANRAIKSYQLFATNSIDNGNNWSKPALISNVGKNYEKTQNQQAVAFKFKDKIYIAWERALMEERISGKKVHIYLGEYKKSNSTILLPENSLDFRISSYEGNSSKPQLFDFKGSFYALWSNNKNGVNRVYLAKKNEMGNGWKEEVISGSKNEAFFAIPVISNNGENINIFWQEETGNGKSYIKHLAPDTSIGKAKLEISPNKKSTSQKVSIRIKLPQDTSGIKGYAFSWSKDESEKVPDTIMNYPNQTKITLEANEDGKWFFKIKVQDNAGNWSNESEVSYEKDTTPPLAPVIQMLNLDSNGYVSSNTFKIKWDVQEEDEIQIKDIQQFICTLYRISKSGTKSLIFSRKTSSEFMDIQNEEDGNYVFSVKASDSCGNIGKAATIEFSLNKYIPYTLITNINAAADDYGKINLTIYGKGFSTDGTITEIIIDKDGKLPYDKILYLKERQFKVESDTKILNASFEEINGGSYKIGLVHSKRGTYWNKKITITENGIVKMGDYSYTYTPDWKKVEYKKYSIQIGDILIALLSLLCLAGILLSFFGITQTAKNSSILQKEINALLKGEPLVRRDAMDKGRLNSTNKKFISIKLKLGIFISSLVVSIIILVSSILGYLNIKNQQMTLAEELEGKINILLDSLSTGAKAYGFKEETKTDLMMLVNQSTSLKAAKYATLTSFPQDENNLNINYIWATNENILTLQNKINTSIVKYGNTQLDISEMKQIFEQFEKISSELTAKDGPIEKINQAKLIAAKNRDGRQINVLDQQLKSLLSNISYETTTSFPNFDNKKISTKNTSYLFCRPILTSKGIIGTVLIEISTTELLKNLTQMRNRIFIITSIIAALILSMGIVATLIFTNTIVKPIKKLSKHVTMIRKTGNKEDLNGKYLKLESNDEIGTLGKDIDDMTHNLVEAAIFENMLLGGKEVQRAFLPLDMVDSVNKTKISVGHMETENVQFFGYYEGAKGVSGDYFDFRKLDERYYALIKCDVSGKGSPAALIMAEVAALFCDYFKTWSIKKNGIKDISNLVFKINDHLETRNLKGKFAAFTMGIFDTQMGDIYFCNAGDNIVHIHDAAEKKLKTITLTETPASGAIPSFMVEMKGGFPIEKIHLNKDDIIFLYTDGIEEAKRLYRDKISGENFKFKPDSKEIADGENQDTNESFEDGEELGADRVKAVIEAVLSRKNFKLIKKANPIEDMTSVDFDFDFSKCEGTPEDAVMALICVEKAFRLYKDSETNENSHAIVDKKVDKFMKKCFVQYDAYCSNTAEHPKKELQTEYMYYTNVKEDEQFDDLTLVAIKKK
ncbi:MAG: SpoIIE family protein phosphatase [Treponemataceae bacterium]